MPHWQKNDPYLRSAAWDECRRRKEADNIATYGQLTCTHCARQISTFQLHHSSYEFQRRELQNWDQAQHQLHVWCGRCHHDHHFPPPHDGWDGFRERLRKFDLKYGFSPRV